LGIFNFSSFPRKIPANIFKKKRLLVEFLQLVDKKESSVTHAKEFLWKQCTKVARIWLIPLTYFVDVALAFFVFYQMAKNHPKKPTDNDATVRFCAIHYKLSADISTIPPESHQTYIVKLM
jgi:hypothetical protein